MMRTMLRCALLSLALFAVVETCSAQLYTPPNVFQTCISNYTSCVNTVEEPKQYCPGPDFSCTTHINGQCHKMRYDTVDEKLVFELDDYEKSGCDERRSCLFFDDAGVQNLALVAAKDVFPTVDADDINSILRNAAVRFTERSELVVPTIGTYFGVQGIAEYQAILHKSINNDTFDLELHVTSADSRSGLYPTTDVFYNVEEDWIFERTPSRLKLTERPWRVTSRYRPCSIIMEKEQVGWTTGTTDGFVTVATRDGMMERMCHEVTANCTGVHKQFDSFADCMQYYNQLPLFDESCRAIDGAFSLRGESYLCKFLHHFMIQFTPELHCHHAGPGNSSDADGGLKCHVTECRTEEQLKAMNYTGLVPGKKTAKAATCSNKIEEDMETRTLSAIPFCLTSMFSGNCSSNCSQALNTLYSPFTDEELCECGGSEMTLRSHILKTLHVTPASLFAVCNSNGEATRRPACKNTKKWQDPEPYPVCLHPSYYWSQSGCRQWNWKSIEVAYLNGFREERLFQDSWKRANFSSADSFNSLTMHEWLTYQRVFQDHIYLEFGPFQKRWATLVGKPDGIFPLTTDLEMHSKHADVLSIMHGYHNRSDNFGNSWLPMWMGVIHNPNNPVHINSGTVVREQVPALISYILPNLYGSGPLPLVGTVEEGHLAFSDDMSYNIFKMMFRTLWTDLLNVRINKLNQTMQDEMWEDLDDWIPMLQLNVPHEPVKTLELTNHLLTTAFLRQKDRFEEKLAIMIGDDIDAFFATLTKPPVITKTDAIQLIGTVLWGPGLGLGLLTKTTVEKLHKYPCDHRDLWDSNPGQYLREVMRLHMQNNAQIQLSVNGKKRYYALNLAHVDEEVFANPLKFDPYRANNTNIFPFGALEGEILGTITPPFTTLPRVCPARQWIYRFVQQAAPLFLPKPQCSGNKEVFGDVMFTPMKQLRPEGQTMADLEVLCADIVGGDKCNNAATTCSGDGVLFLLESKGVEAPEFWAPTISSLRRNKDATVWVFNPIGNGEVLRLASQMAAVIRHARKDCGFDTTVIVAVSAYGWVTAHMLDQARSEETLDYRKYLDGILSVNFGHPAVTLPAITGHVSKSFFAPFLSPIATTAASNRNWRAIRQAYRNTPGFTHQMEGALVRALERRGPTNVISEVQDNFRVRPGSLETEPWSSQHGYINYGLMNANVPVRMLYEAEHPIWGNKDLYAASLKYTGRAKIVPLNESGYSAGEFTRLRYNPRVADAVAQEILEFLHDDIENNEPYFFMRLSHEDMLRVIVVVITLILLQCGFALEYLNTGMLMDYSAESTTAVWRYAQAISGLMLFIGLYSQSIFGAPFFIFGLFKFGFPEVWSLYRRFSHTEYDSEKWAYGIDLLATLTHHTGGTWIFMCLVTHIIPIDQRTIGIFLPVLIMHSVSYLKYTFAMTHAVLLLTLEVWYQFELAGNWHEFEWFPLIGMMAMWAAHILYVLSGLILFIFVSPPTDKDGNPGPAIPLTRRLGMAIMGASTRSVAAAEEDEEEAAAAAANDISSQKTSVARMSTAQFFHRVARSAEKHQIQSFASLRHKQDLRLTKQGSLSNNTRHSGSPYSPHTHSPDAQPASRANSLDPYTLAPPGRTNSNSLSGTRPGHARKISASDKSHAGEELGILEEVEEVDEEDNAKVFAGSSTTNLVSANGSSAVETAKVDGNASEESENSPDDATNGTADDRAPSVEMGQI